MKANDRQVGGDHYRSPIQHWDFAAANRLDYFQGQITKYVCRWREKNGIEDLKKAQHFLQKYVEVEEAAREEKSRQAKLAELRRGATSVVRPDSSLSYARLKELASQTPKAAARDPLTDPQTEAEIIAGELVEPPVTGADGSYLSREEERAAFDAVHPPKPNPNAEVLADDPLGR